MKEKIGDFNLQSESYHLVLQCAVANVSQETGDLMEYGQMIAMQMGAGKGPDILVSYAFNFMDYLAGKGRTNA